MSKQTRGLSPLCSFLPAEIEGFDELAELALDLRWLWNHYADELWRQLDPDLWKITQNPWVILQTVSRDQIQRISADPAFRKKDDALVKARREAAEAPAWFQQNYQPRNRDAAIALVSRNSSPIAHVSDIDVHEIRLWIITNSAASQLDGSFL